MTALQDNTARPSETVYKRELGQVVATQPRFAKT
jgi:hypothetical protein